MRKFENHFTSLEQSKRLLELGLPADSADCYFQDLEYHEEGIDKTLHTWIGPLILNCDTYEEEVLSFPTDTLYPCWSVGRLIEIAELMVGSTTWQDYQQPSVEKPTLVERAVCTIENLCNLIKFGFEKLL